MSIYANKWDAESQMGIEFSPLDGGQRKAGTAGHLEGVVEAGILLPGVGNLVKDRDGGATTVAVHICPVV